MDPAVPLLYDALEHDAEFLALLSVGRKFSTVRLRVFRNETVPSFIAPNYRFTRCRSQLRAKKRVLHANLDHALPDHHSESLLKNSLYLSKDCVRLKHEEPSSRFSIYTLISSRKRMAIFPLATKESLGGYRSSDI